MFTLAHICDPHLAPLPRPSVRQLANKRLLGYLNWRRSRKAIHARPVLDALVKDMLEQSPDHIAVGGDLINLALPREYTNALAWLKSLGGPERVSVVPGNHDTYVRVARESGIGLWDAFMRTNAGGQSGFPFVRRFGNVALIGLNTAIPTPPFFATGHLDRGQLDALEKILGELGGTDIFRIVLLHHPPLPGLSRWRHALREVEALRDILSQKGAELVLYGHTHTQAVTMLPATTGALSVVGAPSASSARGRGNALARYNLFRIQHSSKGWRCEMTGRGPRVAGGAVTQLERRMLIPVLIDRDPFHGS